MICIYCHSICTPGMAAAHKLAYAPSDYKVYHKYKEHFNCTNHKYTVHYYNGHAAYVYFDFNHQNNNFYIVISYKNNSIKIYKYTGIEILSFEKLFYVSPETIDDQFKTWLMLQ